LDARFEIPRWLHRELQKSYKFENREDKWIQKSWLTHIHGKTLAVIFRGYLNDDVWTTLAELSHFYRQVFAKEIKKEMMEKLEKQIPML
jgi:hypothetical protein